MPDVLKKKKLYALQQMKQTLCVSVHPYKQLKTIFIFIE